MAVQTILFYKFLKTVGFVLTVILFYLGCIELLHILVDEIVEDILLKSSLKILSPGISIFVTILLLSFLKPPKEYITSLGYSISFYIVLGLYNMPIEYGNYQRANGDYYNPFGADTTGQQNVHDSQVLSTIKISIEKLKKNVNITRSISQTIKDVRELIMQCVIDMYIDSPKMAIDALDIIEKNIEIITAVNCKEIDALHLVWNRILEKDLETQKNLKEILVYELNDMYSKDGYPLCSTGRITRIIDTLNVIDNDVKIVPTHLINEEMMNKSSKIRTDLLNEFNDKEKSELEKGTSSLQTEFDYRLKRIILLSLEKDYVKSDIMTKDKFVKETSKWINHI